MHIRHVGPNNLGQNVTVAMLRPTQPFIHSEWINEGQLLGLR